MKKLFLINIMLLFAFGINAQQSDCSNLTGSYLGQTLPGTIPGLFAPGIISTDDHEFSCCFSPDGTEFYFTRRNPETRRPVVMVCKQTEGRWTKPEPLAALLPIGFTFEPFITPDNTRLYFQTSAVVNDKPEMLTRYLERTKEGWSDMKDPGEAFNPGKTMHISATMDGTIYTTDISGGMGSESLGMIRMVNDQYEKLEKLGGPFNKTEKQQHPWIAPDESFIIFTVRRPGQTPVSVLFCAFRNQDGDWSDPVELNLGMDAGQPYVSPDGKYLFFTSGDPKVGSDIYCVSAKIIEELRPVK